MSKETFMQTIHVTLQDPQLEQAMQQFISQYHENIENLVINALRYYIKEMEQTLVIQKLDPLKHSQPPSTLFRPISNNEIKAFQEIESSAIFAKKLRQQAWRDE
jgi:hypothetical protein